MGVIRTCLGSKYFDVSGRASRREFWTFASFACFVMATAARISPILAILPGAYLFPPLLSVTVRRLHDCDIPGRILWLVILLGGILLEIPVGRLVLAAMPCLLLICLLRTGTSGPNSFGDDPLLEAPKPFAEDDAGNRQQDAPYQTHPLSPADASPGKNQKRHGGRGRHAKRNVIGRIGKRIRSLVLGRPTCPNCSAYVAADDRYCKTCGFDLDKRTGKTCPECGAALEDEGFYCPECGARIQ